MRDKLLGLIYLTPATVLLLLFFVTPLSIMVWLSFFQQQGFVLGSDWSLANYRAFFSKPYYVQALWNSLGLSAIVTIISVLLAYPLAYILAFSFSPTWQRIAIVACVLPFWTSYLVRSYSWLLALSGNGVVAQTALYLGLGTGEGLANTTTATAIGFVHFFVMLLTLTIFAGLVRIPRNMLRAAADLGAGRIQQFLTVILPLSLPGVIAGAMMTFVLALGDYITPQILGGGKQLVLTQVAMLQIQREGNFPMASAISVILMIISVAATLVANRAISETAK